MKKFLAFLLAVVMIASLSVCMLGCGKDEATKATTAAPAAPVTIIGTWEAEWDMSEMMSSQLASFMPDAGSANEILGQIDFAVEDFNVKVKFVFSEDGNASFEADQNSFKTSAKAMMEGLVSSIFAAAEKMVKEQLAAQDKTLEEFETSMGMSVNAYLTSYFEQSMGCTISQFIDSKVSEIEIPGNLNSSGPYTLEGNKLSLGDDSGFLIELEANKLTLKEYFGPAIPDSAKLAMELFTSTPFVRAK